MDEFLSASLRDHVMMKDSFGYADLNARTNHIKLCFSLMYNMMMNLIW